MNNVNKNVCAHIIVKGRVQGVAFRYHARNFAHQIKVYGWIRNLTNGDVELMVEGTKNSVEEMVKWCKIGPPMALVENVVVDWLPFSGKYMQFKIIQ